MTDAELDKLVMGVALGRRVLWCVEDMTAWLRQRHPNLEFETAQVRKSVERLERAEKVQKFKPYKVTPKFFYYEAVR